MSREKFNATISRDSEHIHVRFSDEGIPSRVVPIELVLDFNQFGEAIGIEIVSLKYFGGAAALPATRLGGSSEVEFTYDEAADAATLIINGDRSLDQRAVDGWLELDGSGQLVGIKGKIAE